MFGQLEDARMRWDSSADRVCLGTARD